MSKFVKKDELQLINGGYVSDKDGNPITNEAFIKAQKRAEYVVTFARLAKNKNFKESKVDSLAELKKAVNDELAAKTTEFVAVPTKVEQKLKNQLADEAMAFMNYEESKSKVDKINTFLTKDFAVLKDFEDFGLFFENGIVKLGKIYTIAEVTAAVEQTIDLLD